MDNNTSYCPQCGQAVTIGDRFCRSCAHPLGTAPAERAAEAPAAEIPRILRYESGVSYCSHCQQYVRKDATFCKHCKAVFGQPLGTSTAPTATPAPAAPKQRRDRSGVILALIIVSLVGFFYWIGQTPPSGGAGGASGPRTRDQVDAWVDCRSFVEKGLKAPSTAQFPLSSDPGVTIVHLSNGRWSVLGFVDAQNSFGAQIREDFGCQISYSGDNVTVHQLRIGDQVLVSE